LVEPGGKSLCSTEVTRDQQLNMLVVRVCVAGLCDRASGTSLWSRSGSSADVCKIPTGVRLLAELCCFGIALRGGRLYSLGREL
jgi:hypothetical protein